MGSTKAHFPLAGVLLAVLSHTDAARITVDSLSSSVKEKALALTSSRLNASASGGRAVKCNLDSRGNIIMCGDELECVGTCVKQTEVDIAGVTQDEACSTRRLRVPKCGRNAYSLWSMKVHIPGLKSPKYCCLCPLGKKFDARTNSCVTRSLEDQRVECHRVPGACKDNRQMLDLAGGSPEEACRTRSYFVRGCPATAWKHKRTAIDIPKAFGGKLAYCCFCPENSVWNGAKQACVCRRDASVTDTIVPKAGECPASQDARVAEEASALSPEGRKAAPAMRQIRQVRGWCWNHRVLDEIADPAQHKNSAIRLALGGANAIVIDKLVFLRLNTLIEFNEEASGTTIEFIEDLDLRFGMGKLTVYVEGKHFSFEETKNDGLSMLVEARVSGKDLLSMVTSFGAAGKLAIKLAKVEIQVGTAFGDIDLNIRRFITKALEKEILGAVCGYIFTELGLALRMASVEGPLTTAMQGRDIHPLRARTTLSQGDCAKDKLCLDVDIQAGQKQEPETRLLGADVKTIKLNTEVTDGGNFETRLQGLVDVDFEALISDVVGAETESTIDIAYGRTPPKLPVDEETMNKQEAMMTQSEACAARRKDWNLHRNVLAAVRMGDAVKRVVDDAAGAVYGLYDYFVPAGPKVLQVPSSPGDERGDFESKLLQAWYGLHPGQKALLSRSQEQGHEPKFAVLSLRTANIEATGSFDVTRKPLDAMPARLEITGFLKLDVAKVLGMRMDACQPKSRFTEDAEFAGCWKATLSEIDVGIVPTGARVFASLEDDGDMVACVTVETFQVDSSWNGYANAAVNALAWSVGAKRLLEDVLETQLAAALYKMIVVQQQGQIDSAKLDVIVKPGHVDVDLRLGAKWTGVSNIEAQLASEPPKLRQMGETQSGVGSAWQVLKEMSADRKKEAGPKLAGATEKFTYNPKFWIAPGLLMVTSEMVDQLKLEGTVDFEKAEVPVKLTGNLRIDLHKVLRIQVNDPGMKDWGGYHAAAQNVHVRDGKMWHDMEAVLTCGYLYLSSPTSAKAEHFRITNGKGALRHTHQIDITKSAATARRDGEKSHFELEGECQYSVKKEDMRQYYAVSDSGVQLHICVRQDSHLGAALPFEIYRRGVMDKMILEQGYEAGMLWSFRKNYWKTTPFEWRTSFGSTGDSVRESCGDELERCELGFACMGVRLLRGVCYFMNVYDVRGFVDGEYLFKVYEMGLPETWGIDSP